MSDLAKELNVALSSAIRSLVGAGTLTSEQVDAITHAWLDLRVSCYQDSVEELEEAFPFLLEGVEDDKEPS